jgi:nitroreductase
MKDILGIIKARRSIRNFSGKKLKSADIIRILEAGRWAPSGLNNQPWRFLVIEDEERRSRIAAFTAYGSIIRRAAAVIIVCMDTADSYNRDKDLMAIGASIQNMLLEAKCHGIGTCWMGEILNKKKEVADALKLGDDLDFLAAIAMGYPAGKMPKGCRKSLKKLLIEGSCDL